jgi:hypothetical protein
MGAKGWMMRQLMVVVSACVLASAVAAPVVAQEPSPSTQATMHADDYVRMAEELLEELQDQGVRYESPEVGLAIAFSGDWYALESEAGWGTFLEARSLSDPEYCYVQANEVQQEDVSAAGATEALVAGYEREGHADVRATPVRLPTGEAWRVDAQAGSGQLTVYVTQSDQLLVALHCSAVGSERPEDRWRSIAETIEFLPEEE